MNNILLGKNIDGIFISRSKHEVLKCELNDLKKNLMMI